MNFKETIKTNKINDIFLTRELIIFFVNTDNNLTRQKTLFSFAFNRVEHELGSYDETASYYLDKKPIKFAEIRNNGKDKFTFAESLGFVFETAD